MLPCKTKFKHLCRTDGRRLPGLEGDVQCFMKDIMIERIMKTNASGDHVVLHWSEIKKQVFRIRMKMCLR